MVDLTIHADFTATVSPHIEGNTVGFVVYYRVSCIVQNSPWVAHGEFFRTRLEAIRAAQETLKAHAVKRQRWLEHQKAYPPIEVTHEGVRDD